MYVQPAHPLRAVDVTQLLCSLLDVHSALTLAVMGDTTALQVLMVVFVLQPQLVSLDCVFFLQQS